MAPCKLKPATVAQTPSTASKVTKPKRYRNGLVNLEKTPADLLKIAKRNATASPLLRLPPEIRNKIWSFAIGGQLVVLPDEENSKGFAIRIKLKEDSTGYIPLTFCGQEAHFEITKLRAAFHLPEVCRQVYSETVLTSYRENVFLCDSVYPATKTSFGRLKAAQRKAITAVEFNPWVLYSHVALISTIQPVTSTLPNMKVISVSSVALKCGYGKNWWAYMGMV
ncbi:beta transducin [Didymella sp. IMI 355093]|nr:beta transducin [Didymella sp. IMI 355093]